jgi:hypothetical protein
MARPQALTDEQFTQALYAAAIALLGGSAGAATSQGVDANDAGVLYALLLLFRTQHCVPRVPVYVHLGAAPAPARAARWRCAEARLACADKVKSLLSLHRQAVDAKHEDVLRVFRVLLAEDALVLGSVAQVRALHAQALPSASRGLTLPRAARRRRRRAALDGHRVASPVR